MRQQLIIQFANRRKTIIFQGESVLRKNLVDEISIFYDRIILSFDRKKPVDLQTCLFSKKSLFRYEVQKALCYYLAVTGTLPKIKEITMSGKNGVQILEDVSFVDRWHNCKVTYLLKPSIAAQIFRGEKKAKAAYIALTFFLKAQLDYFSHDRFRAAWSGLNVIYSTLAPKEATKEWEKHKAFKKYFEGGTLENVINFVSELDEQFWDKLDWYSYTRNLCTGENRKIKPIDNVKEKLFNLQDPMLIRRIANYMKAVVYTGQEGDFGKKDDYKRYQNAIEKKINKGRISYSARACFLIVEYGYFLRNRSFHAENAYPLFPIEKEASDKTVEEILTELILMTIEGMFREL